MLTQRSLLDFDGDFSNLKKKKKKKTFDMSDLDKDLPVVSLFKSPVNF